MPVSWNDAFAEIGREMRAITDRQSVIFYSSGRSSNEASYLYGLLARLYGNNNLPDSSNMCHETTSVALLGQHRARRSARRCWRVSSTRTVFCSSAKTRAATARACSHPLQEASERGVPIITYNPLRERGLERFTNPQSPAEMLTGKQTRISSAYHPVKAGGDSGGESPASARR